MLERSQVYLLDKLGPNLGLFEGKAKDFAYALTQLLLQGSPIAVDNRGEGLKSAFLYFHVSRRT